MTQRTGKWIFGIGVALVVGAVGFRTLALPSIVRFPLNIDETTHYTGTALTYVDPTTAAPLSEPLRQPLTVDRRTKVIAGSANRAVIAETVTVAFGTTTSVENYQYVLDRHSMKMVSDPRQFAFNNPGNRIHAANAFRVTWPMGTTARSGYPSYMAQTDATIPLTLVQGRHRHQNAGVSVIDFGSRITHLVAPYYLAHLKDQGLPMQLSAAQMAPQLQAAGLDVTRALTDLAPQLTVSEQQLLTTTLAKPIPLKYFYVVDGIISVEPRTGALVSVHADHEGLAVQPDLSGSAPLTDLLTKYASIPSVKAASAGLTRLAGQPPTLVEDFQYTQTSQSAAHLGSKARQQIRQLNLVQVQLPWAVGILGGALTLLAVGLTLGKRGPEDAEVARPSEATAVSTAA